MKFLACLLFACSCLVAVMKYDEALQYNKHSVVVEAIDNCANYDDGHIKCHVRAGNYWYVLNYMPAIGQELYRVCDVVVNQCDNYLKNRPAKHTKEEAAKVYEMGFWKWLFVGDFI